ncbi:hypothetical protein PanWU01x14_323930 [Parasponia andersonii]|uniref:Uncharacterized protein n=1 Tax=Parasponia andersonii TaxID=3476 RepID=A0A2P5AKG5_PARAD|nr:hypothetical protein PanWU01x14_323930 [Parasponia andersonii]
MAKMMNEPTMIVKMTVEALHYLPFSPYSKEVTSGMVSHNLESVQKRKIVTCRLAKKRGKKS